MFKREGRLVIQDLGFALVVTEFETEWEAEAYVQGINSKLERVAMARWN